MPLWVRDRGEHAIRCPGSSCVLIAGQGVTVGVTHLNRTISHGKPSLPLAAFVDPVVLAGQIPPQVRDDVVLMGHVDPSSDDLVDAVGVCQDQRAPS